MWHYTATTTAAAAYDDLYDVQEWQDYRHRLHYVMTERS
jgi:hypothetical protein